MHSLEDIRDLSIGAVIDDIGEQLLVTRGINMRKTIYFVYFLLSLSLLLLGYKNNLPPIKPPNNINISPPTNTKVV